VSEQRPKPSVGVIIFKDGKTLLGRRKGAHGEGEYGSVGGHLEFGETPQEGVYRELAEECGITIKNLRFLCVVNSLKYDKHYVDIGFVADWEAGEPQILEPDYRLDWGWYELDKLPEPLFDYVRVYLEAYKSGKHYLEV
jgi:8-oxo-dGTP diphosphatase